MQSQDLPLVAGSAPVAATLALLRERNVAAVVVRAGRQLWLVYVSALADGVAAGVETVAALPTDVYRPLEDQDRIVARDARDARDRYDAESGQYQQQQQRQQSDDGYDFVPSRGSYDFAASTTSDGAARVFATSSELAASLVGTLVCERNPAHLFPTPVLRYGDECTRCPTTMGIPGPFVR